jgi:hypothetical protein
MERARGQVRVKPKQQLYGERDIFYKAISKSTGKARQDS